MYLHLSSYLRGGERERGGGERERGGRERERGGREGEDMVKREGGRGSYINTN